MNQNLKPLLISLKPDYAELVFAGTKKAELRRRISADLSNRDVFIYVSSPVMELRGGFRIGQVWEGTPNQIWSTVRSYAGITRRGFDEYYEGQNIAYALEIVDVWQYRYPRTLSQLREQFANFIAPQSYRYAKEEEIRSFRALKRVSNVPLAKAV